MAELTEIDTARGARADAPVPRLDIVIVNWNTGEYLRECLRSVAASNREQFRLESVVVVDNASSDDSLDELEQIPLPLRIVRNTTNRGFAAACNQGAREGDGDLILFLNPDTRVYPDTLDRATAFIADPENAGVGICGGRMVNDSGEEEYSCWRFPTLWMWSAKILGIAQAFPRWVATQRINSDELTRSGFVDQVIGAFFMLHRDLFETLGGFDERFFVYLEDVDLALRAAHAGRRSYYMADLPIVHKGRVSSDQVLGKRLFYLLRGRNEFARKHWSPWQATVLGSLMLLVEIPVRLAIATMDRNTAEAKGVGEAAISYVRYFVLGGPGRTGI